jgi:hypothetical protein
MIFFLKVQRIWYSSMLNSFLRLSQSLASFCPIVNRRGALKKAGFSSIIRPVVHQSRKALVLFSGGIDFMTALFWARSRHDEVCEVDPMTCPQYGGMMKVIASLTDYSSSHLSRTSLRPRASFIKKF